MADVIKSNINMEMLEGWYKDTEVELKDVDNLLEKFSTVLDKADDDTFCSICQKIGKGMADAYIGLRDAFKDTINKTGEMLKDWKAKFHKIGEGLKGLAEGFHL